MIKLMDILNEFWPFGKKQSKTPQPSVKKKAGAVWQTPGGRFGAINAAYRYTTKYFDTEEKARRYATAKIKKPAPQPEKQTPSTPPNSLAQNTSSDAEERRKQMFGNFSGRGFQPLGEPFQDVGKKYDDEKILRKLRQLHMLRQLQQYDDSNNDKDSKFGGGGEFSGGGGGSSF